MDNSLFFKLWMQKLFRNVASLKFQVLLLLYILVVYGMFTTNSSTNAPYISDTIGCGLLGGGFITLALGRIIANTALTEKEDLTSLNTDK